MILFEELTPAQTRLIKEICYLQLSSLRRIYNDETRTPLDLTLLLIEYEVTPEEFKASIELTMDKFKALVLKPDNIHRLDKAELSVFRHILATVEDKYKDRYPKAIANLWNRLFIIGDLKDQIGMISNLN